MPKMFMEGDERTESGAAVPVHVDSFKDQRLVVELKDDQQKNQKQHHEDAHDRGRTPSGDNLAVLGVEGTEQIAQSSALCHSGPEVSGEVQFRYCKGPDPEEGRSCREI